MALTFYLFLQLFIHMCSTFKFEQAKMAKLEKVIKEQMKLANLYTVGIIVTNETDTLYQNIFSKDNKATIITLFVIGSVSKSFTALGILKLNESLNNNILNQTLEEIGINDDFLDKELLKDITVRELLNHTSGLDSFNPKRVGKKGDFIYSNFGFGLLGKVIEKLSGKRYKEYMKE